MAMLMRQSTVPHQLSQAQAHIGDVTTEWLRAKEQNAKFRNRHNQRR